MTEDIPHYSATFESVPISTEQLSEFTTMFLGHFPTLALAPVWIQPRDPKRRDTWDASFDDLIKAIASEERSLRKYRLEFCDYFDLKSKCPKYPSFFLTVRLRDYRPNAPYPRVTVEGQGCWQQDYVCFMDTAVQQLGLTLHQDYPFELENSTVKAHYRRVSSDSAIFATIHGSLEAGQYDTALRTAASLIEDALRQKCIACGREEAKTQQASDLAVTAFHRDNGCLEPPWPVAVEAQLGAQMMFQGFFKYLRNAFAHNAIVMGDDRSAVLECLMLCEFLLKLINGSRQR